MRRNIICLILLFSSLPFFSTSAQANPEQLNRWNQVDIRGLGFVTGILFHPITGELYSRTDVGGLFRWDSTAERWINLTDRYARNQGGFPQQVESFALDPVTPWTIYAVMGDNLPDFNDEPTTIIKSRDNGATWEVLATFSEDVLASGGNREWRHAGERLAIDPNNPELLYFGSRAHGLWRSLDAGQSWQTVQAFPTVGGFGGEADSGGLSFVLFDPDETTDGLSQNIYVGAFDEGVFRSADGGQSWCKLTGGPELNPIHAQFIHSRLHVAYTGSGLYGDGGIYTFDPGSSCDSGGWSDKTPPSGPVDCPVWEAFAWGAIAIHPFDEDIALIAPFGVTPRKLFLSFNFTAPEPTWILTTDEATAAEPGPYGACPEQAIFHTFDTPAWYADTTYQYDFAGGLAINPNLPDQVWIATGHGTIRVNDFWNDGSVFEYDQSMVGMEELCTMDLLAPPSSNLNPLYSMHWDAIGFRHDSLNNPPTGKISTEGIFRGRTITISAQNPETLVALASQGDRRLSLITDDAGQSWEPLPGFNDPHNGQVAHGGNIAISSTDPSNMVWAPANEPDLGSYTPPHVTFDAGQSWTAITDLDFEQGSFPLHNQAWHGQMLIADQFDGSTFYYYIQGFGDPSWDAVLYRSTNGGRDWSQVSSTPLPGWDIAPQLMAAPGRSGHLWLASPMNESLHHSPDGGGSWVEVSSAEKIYQATVGAPLAGQTEPTIYIYGLVNGVESLFYSTDNAQTWRQIGHQLSSNSTSTLPLSLINLMEAAPDDPGRLYLGTSCRGIFYINLSTVDPATLSQKVYIPFLPH